MTKKRIIEYMARLDEVIIYSDLWSDGGKWWTAIDGNVGRINIPNYTEDLNAVHRVLCGLSDNQVEVIFEWLSVIILGVEWDGDNWLHNNYEHLIKATAAQLCEAILKAVGKWSEDLNAG